MYASLSDGYYQLTNSEASPNLVPCERSTMGPGEIGPSKILVVDDDRTIATTMSVILREYGYDVATAFSGEEAVEKAKFFSPDLLLSDIWMDSMNGIEAAVRINARLPGLKILFLSGDATMLDVLKSFPKRIVYSLMLKPARVPDLLNAIAYMLPTIQTTKTATSVEVDSGSMQDAATLEVTAPPIEGTPHSTQALVIEMTLAISEQRDEITVPASSVTASQKKPPVRSLDHLDDRQENERKISGFPAT
jgi:CheY-like chemotaxis protein